MKLFPSARRANRPLAKAWPFRVLACALAAFALCSNAVSVSAYPTHNRYLLVQDEAAIPEGAIKPFGSARIVMPLRDDPKQRIVGKIVWFNLKTVSYIDRDDKQQEITWSELDPERLPRLLGVLPDRRDAESLLLVSELLIIHGGDERDIEKLFVLALKADDGVQAKVDALRDKMKNGGGEDAGNDKPDEGDEGEDAGEGEEGNNAGQPDPNANPRAWPVLTDEQHKAAVDNLIKTTNAVLEKMNHKMGQTETERFLVYSDMPAKESKYWVGVLDKMYVKLCETFDLDEDVNIWNGKCLLMFFNNRNDFLKYNVAAYGNNPTGAAGICYQFGSGDVHISMWKQNPKLELAHTLVHEAVHGFLFRYQSSHYVPNWLNEGLAEYISVALVDPPGYPGRADDARRFVKGRNSLDNFLSARNIIGPHYGLAFDVTNMMVRENRKGYVKMIQGLKAGKTVQEAFDEDYGASVNKVMQYYARTRLKMDGIRVDLP